MEEIMDTLEKQFATEKDIDLQIDSLDKEIAGYTQKLFKAQGALEMMIHIKGKFKFEPKKEVNGVTDSPT